MSIRTPHFTGNATDEAHSSQKEFETLHTLINGRNGIEPKSVRFQVMGFFCDATVAHKTDEIILHIDSFHSGDQGAQYFAWGDPLSTHVLVM